MMIRFKMIIAGFIIMKRSLSKRAPITNLINGYLSAHTLDLEAGGSHFINLLTNGPKLLSFNKPNSMKYNPMKLFMNCKVIDDEWFCNMMVKIIVMTKLITHHNKRGPMTVNLAMAYSLGNVV
jgi:hypothetical protein